MLSCTAEGQPWLNTYDLHLLHAQQQQQNKEQGQMTADSNAGCRQLMEGTVPTENMTAGRADSSATIQTCCFSEM